MLSHFLALLLSTALAQKTPTTCDVCWDGSVPQFNGASCEPCPLQEATKTPTSECDAEIAAFCNNVQGTFDATKCACYLEYLPDEDQWTNEPSDEEDDNATPVDEDGSLPWDESDEPSDEILDPKGQWESLQEDLMLYQKKYRWFGYAQGALLFASAAAFKFISRKAQTGKSTKYALKLSAMMGMGSLSNLVLIGLEWLLRNFNRLGRIANRALYYPLKYACWLQIGAVIMLVGYAIKAYNSGEKPQLAVFALYGAWYAIVRYLGKGALAYLEILREENYDRLVDWSFFESDDVDENGMVVIDESNYFEYQIHSRRRALL